MFTHLKRILIILCTVAGLSSVARQTWGDEPLKSATLYADDPQHLWNRIHAALLVRTGPDGKDYGYDRLEPLLWDESQYLLSGDSHQRIVALLEEFDRLQGETLVNDPLKRAILQRDLWLVANWLSKVRGSHARLEIALHKAILRLALSTKQIDELPDNYLAAVATKTYAAHFNQERPTEAYLPADLFQDNGPWVCVAPAEGLAAPLHYHSPFDNSAFLVFLKLPGGRKETLEFLKQLEAVKPLLVSNDDERTRPAAALVPHPNFPTWPSGTEVALVRRAMLIDTERRIVVSHLTESVQLRVITVEPTVLTKEVLENSASRLPPPVSWQTSFEYQLRKADLFGGMAGGLCDVSEERDFKTGFGAHGWDEFERVSNNDRPFPARSQPFLSNRASCTNCHNLPGVYSFNSLPGFEMGLRKVPLDADALAKRPPGPTSMQEVEKRVVKWKLENSDVAKLLQQAK